MFESFAVAAYTVQHSSLLAYTAYCVQSWRNEDSRPYGIVHSSELNSFTDIDNGYIGVCAGNPTTQCVSVPTPHTRRLSKNIPVPITEAKLFVRCEATQDTYSFYDEHTKTRKTLCVPTFQNSVMMNTIFRNYKENSNLDAMEESDSDDDFEDMTDDKYSRVGQEQMMMCVYNKGLSGWMGVNAC